MEFRLEPRITKHSWYEGVVIMALGLPMKRASGTPTACGYMIPPG